MTDFLERRVLCEIFDEVTAIYEYTLIAGDITDGGLGGDNSFKTLTRSRHIFLIPIDAVLRATAQLNEKRGRPSAKKRRRQPQRGCGRTAAGGEYSGGM